MSEEKGEEIDPSIYLYDEVYDEIKGKSAGKTKPIEKASHSKLQAKPQSKYIKNMKAKVEARK